MLLLLVMVGVFMIFHNPIFQSIYILLNVCNVLFYHSILYILLVLVLGNWTLSDADYGLGAISLSTSVVCELIK